MKQNLAVSLPRSVSTFSILLLLTVTLTSCQDTPVSPAPSSPRSELIAEVRLLAHERELDPIGRRPSARPELVVLGRSLAFDKILSGNRDISCMTCHLPSFSTGDGRSLPVGQGGSGLGAARAHPGGQFTLRHSPPLFNLHLQRHLFWEGRLEVLADGSIGSPAGDQLTQEMIDVFEFGLLSSPALFPVQSREEMRGPGNELADVDDDDFTELWARLMKRLGAIPEYRRLFEDAYPGTPFDDMTFAHASNAVGGFFASEFTFDETPWDLFLAGDDGQLTDEALEGARAFMTVGCTNCHETDSFVGVPGNEFHNDALAQFGPGQGDGPTGRDDFGRERVTGDPADRRRFVTRPLRNIELTAPYGHVGQFTTLRGFVQHYDHVDSRLLEYDMSQMEPLLQPTLLQNYSEILANRDTLLVPIRLEEATLENLLVFLHALTDDRARDLVHVIPDGVPSGLPIDRMH